MTVEQQRTKRLLGILAQENSKTGKYHPQPSIFRETALDTHKTMTPYDFGPRVDVENKTFFNTRRSASASRTQNRSQKNNLLTAEPEFKSVFKPTPEQEHVCNMAKERRDRVYNSEWALLDTFEAQMLLDERDQRHQTMKATIQGQRRYLDGQMREKQYAKEVEKEFKQQEREYILSEVEKHKAEERRQLEARRQHHKQLKAETEAALAATRRAKEQQLATKRAEEKRALADINGRLDEEKRQAQLKMETAKQQWLKTVSDNEARIAQKKAAEAEQRRKDEELMQETIRTLERQEKEREERTKAFHESIAARANRAGQQAVIENKAREEREARLMLQFQAQKEKEFQEKEASLAAKKAKQKEELLKAREEALGLKAERDAAAKAEVQRLRAEVEEKAWLEQEAEERKLAELRARAVNNTRFIKDQIRTREQQLVTEDTGMADAERQLNARLLREATRVVGGPKQFSVRLM